MILVLVAVALVVLDRCLITINVVKTVPVALEGPVDTITADKEVPQ
jgi:hypothetical protein